MIVKMQTQVVGVFTANLLLGLFEGFATCSTAKSIALDNTPKVG